jgi:hypothetical protein
VTIGNTPTVDAGADAGAGADAAAGPGDAFTDIRGLRIGVGDVTTISGMDVAFSSCARALPPQLLIGTIAALDSKSTREYFNIFSEPLPRRRAASGRDERSCYDCC